MTPGRSRWSWPAVAVSIVVLIVLTGCSRASVSSPGRCPSGVSVDYPPVRDVLFAPSTTWVSVVRTTTALRPKPATPPVIQADGGRFDPVRLDEFSILTPGAPEITPGVIVWMSARDKGLLSRTTSHRLRAFVTLEPADPSRPDAGLIGGVFGENSDGSLTVNGCNNGDSAYFATVGRPSGLTAAQTLSEILIQPFGNLAEVVRNADRIPPTAPWASQSPDERVIDNAPQSVKANLGGVELAFKIPPNWRTLDGTLCSRISLGLNGCAAFSAAVFVKAQDAWVVLTNAWVAPGQPLIVTYQPVAAAAGARSAPIGQVSAAVLQTAHGPNTYVVFDLTGLATPSALLHTTARFEGVEHCCS